MVGKVPFVFTSEAWSGVEVNIDENTIEFENTPAWPVLLMALVTIVMVSCHKWINKCLEKRMPSIFVVGEEDDVVEEIENYWESLDTHDLSWSFHEEEQFRMRKHMFGTNSKFQMLDDHSYDQLKKEYLNRREKMRENAKNHEEGNGRTVRVEPKATIQGCHSYDILANPNYFDDFNYIPVYQKNKDEGLEEK